MGTSAAAPARSIPPDQDSEIIAARIFRKLLVGPEGRRNLADREVTDAPEEARGILRRRILAYLDQENRPGGELTKESRDCHDRLTWLLYVLGRVAGEDPDARKRLLENLAEASQPNEWVRFWTLAGLARSGRRDMEPFTQACAADSHPLVEMLRRAMLARAGVAGENQKLAEALDSQDRGRQWAALRALRVAGTDNPQLVRRICAFIAREDNDNLTYDAIKAAYHVPADCDCARDAARALIQFVERWRAFPGRDAQRAIALIGLGKLRSAAAAPVLVDELTDDNPAIVRQAARSLEVILGPRTAVARVLEAAAGADAELLPAYADALRQMKDREAVAAELGSAMMSGSADQQERSRLLLSELGGVEALQRLRVRSDMMAQYARFLEEAERKIREMFESSVREARKGFRLALGMDVAVFVLGFLLLATSAAMQLYSRGDLSVWAAATGATGVLGILYSLLIAKPRKQVTREVNHLMSLKVVFLGYLRQLHQADQAYVRRILDDKPLESAELKDFAHRLEEGMKAALASLEKLKDTVES